MSGGRLLLILAIGAWIGGLMWAQDAPPVRSGSETNSPAANTNGVTTATNAVPESVVPESVVPESVVPESVVPESVVPELKPVEASPELKPAPGTPFKEDDMKALREYKVIPLKDPFRLTPPPKIEEANIVEPVTVGAPELAGISTLFGEPKAMLRPRAAGRTKDDPKFLLLKPGESARGVEVISIDVEKGTVAVKVGGQTFDLEIKKDQVATKPSATSSNGNRFRPRPGFNPRGNTRKPSSEGSRKSPPKTGGLKPVPVRPNPPKSPSAQFQSPLGYELPAFNESVQKLAVEPSQISTQREIIGGQLNYTPPTDFPEKLR